MRISKKKIFTIIVLLVSLSCIEKKSPLQSDGETPKENEVPLLSIIKPKSDELFIQNARIDIQVEASDDDGNVAWVKFIIDSTEEFTDFQAPYGYSKFTSGMNMGSHLIEIEVQDDDGMKVNQSILIYLLSNTARDLTVGNKFYYKTTHKTNSNVEYRYQEVIKDTIINGKEYAIIHQQKFNGDQIFESTYYQRSDSTAVYDYGNPESVIFDFSWPVGEHTVTSNDSCSTFGIKTKCINLDETFAGPDGQSWGAYDRIFSKHFGLIYKEYSLYQAGYSLQSHDLEVLTGAVIVGKTYGDILSDINFPIN